MCIQLPHVHMKSTFNRFELEIVGCYAKRAIDVYHRALQILIFPRTHSRPISQLQKYTPLSGLIGFSLSSLDVFQVTNQEDP